MARDKKETKLVETTKAAAAHEKPLPESAYTIIIADENGQYYKLTRGDWAKHQLPPNDYVEKGALNRLLEYGVVVAALPETALGAGFQCVFVNMKAILRGYDGNK
jgi:hypothetical protein